MIILILSLSSFSWNATAQIRDTSYVILPTEIARQVAIDLVEGDAAKEKVINLEESLRIQKEIITEQDSLLTVSEKRYLVSQQVLQGVQKQLRQDEVLQERLEGKVKTNRAYAIGFGCTTALSIAGIVAILVLGGK